MATSKVAYLVKPKIVDGVVAKILLKIIRIISRVLFTNVLTFLLNLVIFIR